MNEYRTIPPADASCPAIAKAIATSLTAPRLQVDLPGGDEPSGMVKIRIPDPLESLPKAARRVGGRHHQRPNIMEMTDIPAAPIADWGIGHVKSVVSAPAVTFHSRSSTFDLFSVKTRRVVFGTGPHEFAFARELEADPFVVDYDLQAIRLTWSSDEREHYTADAVYLTAAGHIVPTEVKASESYFQDPKYQPVMWNAERSFQAAGLRFRKVTGDEMDDQRRRSWNVDRVFHDRGMQFSEREIGSVVNLLTSNCGSAALGRVVEGLSSNQSVGRQKLNAMMCSRIVSYDLNTIVTGDTEVSAAPQCANPVNIRRIGL